MIDYCYRFFCLCLLSLAPYLSTAQTPIDWIALADIQLEEKSDPEFGIDYFQASFGSIATFEGQEVSIKGFIIPLDPLGTQYVLSRNPQTSCFFCGGAGPETVLKLELKPSAFKRYKTDTNLTFKGTLKLNTDTREDLLYVLEEAEEF